MRVKQSSWHYWLWQIGRDPRSRPKDLCRYFWHIVLVKLLAPLTLLGLALFGIGTVLWLMYGHPVATGIVILGALLAVGLVIGLYFLVQRINERKARQRWERRHNPPPPEVEKEPGWLSLFWQYLAARKRKICPLIEVVDDREAA